MTEITEVIPGLGSPPLTTDPTNFDTRADTLYGTSLPATIASINTWRGQANTVAGEVNTNAASALASATAAASIIDAVKWVSGTTYEIGDPVWSPIDFLTYRRKTDGAGTTDPSEDDTNWELVTVSVAESSTLRISERSSDTILTAADTGALIKITSGTFTQTFDPVADIGANWFVFLQNAGDGEVTVDPDGAELIDGLASYVMYPGEVRLIQCDGTKLTTIVINAFTATFTASGTFTTPPGYRQLCALVWSGGGGGGRLSTSINGGAGGGCFQFTIPAADFGASQTITVGAGGAARTTNGNPTPGGDSSIGTLAVVVGGSSLPTGDGGAVSVGGAPVVSNTAHGVGFEGGDVSTSLSYNAVYGGANCAQNGSKAGGSSHYGGAAGGGIDGATSRDGGTSLYGGDGGASSDTGTAVDGSIPSGGGGATRTGTSGAGARGEVRIWGIA